MERSYDGRNYEGDIYNVGEDEEDAVENVPMPSSIIKCGHFEKGLEIIVEVFKTELDACKIGVSRVKLGKVVMAEFDGISEAYVV